MTFQTAREAHPNEAKLTVSFECQEEYKPYISKIFIKIYIFFHKLFTRKFVQIFETNKVTKNFNGE